MQGYLATIIRALIYVTLVCCLFSSIAFAHSHSNKKLIVKDGRLEGLAHLLNSRESQQLVSNWQGSVNESLAFLQILEPWVLHESPVKIHSKTPADEAPLAINTDPS